LYFQIQKLGFQKNPKQHTQCGVTSTDLNTLIVTFPKSGLMN